MTNPFRLGILVSGSGTNLQAILDKLHGRDGFEVVGVVSNKPAAYALERAARARVQTAVFERSHYGDRADRDAAIADWLGERDVDLVVLAGYMELIEPVLLERFPSAVINVHPALLPAFPGPHPIEDQLAYGVKVGGVTVHFVDRGVDTGPVILQRAVELPYTRDPEEVLEVLHPIEHELLPRAIRLIAEGRVRIDQHNPRLVYVDERALSRR